MLKKRISVICVLMLLMCMVSGCSKKESVTPEELINNASISQTGEYNLTLDTGAKINIGSIMGTEDTEDSATEEDTESGDTESSEESQSMTTDISAKVKTIVGDNENVFVDGTMNLTLFGFSQDVPLKLYMEKTENGYTMYTYNEDAENYTKETSNDISVETIDVFDSTICENLVLDESEDDVYKVNGSVNVKNILNKLSESSISELLEVPTGEDTENIDCTLLVDWVFDKKTRDLRSIELSIPEGSNLTSETEITKFVLSVAVNDYTGNVDIPEDIINNAVESSEAIEDFDSIDFETNFEEETEKEE